MEKRRKKTVHKWHKRVASIDERRYWQNYLCDCNKCRLTARKAKYEFKCAINKMGLLDVYEEEEKTEQQKEKEKYLLALKEWDRKEEEKEERKKKNTYISTRGTVWTVIEEE